jgi:hypothetical protein
MNANIVVPVEVVEIIDRKKMVIMEEQREAQGKEDQKRAAELQSGRENVRDAITQKLQLVPEWLRKFDVTESLWDEDELLSVGRGFSNLDALQLQFHIPGLARIRMKKQMMKGTDQYNVQFKSARYDEDFREYGPNAPKLDFRGDSYWTEDLEYALVEAEMEFGKFEENQSNYLKGLESRKQDAERQLQREQKAEARAAAELTIRESEERELFNVFKDDPVAINLLKAFLMILQERNLFEAQIEDANNSLYSTENYWSSKAAELRRQADNAQRRAEEEKCQLQSDLDDAEAKLKKAERAQRG